jgi:DNA-binding MarR family transcriptional regulator
LVERERPADNRRVVNVGITPGGLELLDRLAVEVRECHEKQLGHLDESEMRTLIALLRKARGPHEADDSPWH